MSTLLNDAEIANFNYLFFNDKEFLGRGGEGEVFKAFSIELKSLVALKRCGPSFQENNLNEAKFLIKLSNSENIVRMHGLLLDSSRIVGYMMEYMEHGSLHDAIHNEGKFKENRLSYGADTILLWVHHAACGIKILHDAGIIHRDIKPQKCGTKKYMAPEIIKDERFKKAGDIYAFAITCWEIIERRVPHEHAISDKDLINSRPEFESDRSTVNKVLQDLIEKGWNRDPKSRPSIEKYVETARVPHEDAISDKDLINSRPEFKSDDSTYVKRILQDLIEKGWSRDPKSRPSIEKFVETVRQYTSLKNTTSVHSFHRCLIDFFSKMEYSDFKERMEIFKQYLADHRAYYLQNSHLYKKGNFIQNIVDRITNGSYHDDELQKCSMHIFAPPTFSEQNRLLLKQQIRNRRKDFSENDSEFSLISVEGGDCFIVIGNYSEGLDSPDSFMRQCEEILKMPYPGRGTTSFPTVIEQRQLYPVPARNDVF